ncbi:MAG: SCP2 sterol-binding domain-containing protein [Gammaproteobacteria bacterium]|nr:SCP2 sterol-binding domain-containing protein [Gammaproteobacteria bacterium]MDH5778615.1 SCP2 sterol-binding domain-containing protein [Gammaproteobacteria bacterium]
MSLFAEFETALTATIENAANVYLRQSPESLDKLAKLQGKVIAVELRGIQQTLYLRPDHQGLLVQGHHEGEVDASLSGTPLSFAELSLSPHANRVLFRGDVKISGDIRLGQDFKRILDELEIDWEELLSKYTGDVIAHKAGDLLRGLSQWSKAALRQTGENAAEYLQQESFDLPIAAEVEPFIKGVDILRDDVERLAARVARLRQNLNS